MSGGEKARILVIDDDEVVLAAIADLLQKDGYAVVSQPSPIGATSVIVRERIDACVIDVNLPVMQGDNVVRLLRGWDRMKELPIILLSGGSESRLKQVASEFRNVRAVPKTLMHTDLPAAIEQLLRGRKKTARQSPSGGQEERALVLRFAEQVFAHLKEAAAAYAKMKKGDANQRTELLRSISMLRGQAHLLGLSQPSTLLGALQVVIESMKPGTRYPENIDHHVQDALRALLGLGRSPTGEFVVSPAGVIAGLTHALSEMHAMSR